MLHANPIWLHETIFPSRISQDSLHLPKPLFCHAMFSSSTFWRATSSPARVVYVFAWRRWRFFKREMHIFRWSVRNKNYRIHHNNQWSPSPSSSKEINDLIIFFSPSLALNYSTSYLRNPNSILLVGDALIGTFRNPL